MQLHESILNGSVKMKATNLMQQPTQKLAKMKFHQLLVEDGMTGAIKNPEDVAKRCCNKNKPFYRLSWFYRKKESIVTV